MLEVTRRLVIPDADLSERFVRSGGPGGQNVNKVATKVELRLDLANCEALSPAVKRRLREAYPSAATRDGAFVVTSSRYRTQAQNRQDAQDKLAEMVRSVLTVPKRRRPTRPSRASRRQRVDEKRQRGETKRLRGRPKPNSAD